MTRNIRARRLVPAVVVSTAVALAFAVTPAAARSSRTAGGKSAATSDHRSKDAAATSIEAPAGGSLTETGSTLLYPLWNLWAPAYHQKFPRVTIQTAGTGSGTGISDATNGTADIGSSDAYLSPSETSAAPTLLNIPLAISAQMIVYNVPGVTAHLELTGKVISAIYRGKITNWDDSAITSLNPGVTIPSLPIVALHRSDGSGDTFLFSQFMTKTTPAIWGSTVRFTTTVSWPNIPNELAENGNSGMVAGCKTTAGCIAYVGISYQTQALGDGLQYADLQNARGKFVLPTSTTINAEAAGFAEKTPADGTISLIYGPAPDGYPIINYEYAIVNTHQSSPSTAKDIRSVLEWAIASRGGNSPTFLSQVNFRPLPARVEAQSVKQIAKIK